MNGLDVLPFGDYADHDPNRLPLDEPEPARCAYCSRPSVVTVEIPPTYATCRAWVSYCSDHRP